MLSAEPPRGPLVCISLACVALLCVAPFLQPVHRFPLTAFYSEWLAFALGLGVMVVLFDRRAWGVPEVPWVALWPLALAALLMVHGALGWSLYFGQALVAAQYLIWAAGLIVAARALVRSCGVESLSIIIAASLATGAMCSALIGIIQHFNVATPLNAFVATPATAAIFGNLAQPNHYASHATLGLFSLVYLHVRGRGAWVITGALPLLFVLGLSGSRSAWLYLLTAFFLAAWLRKVMPVDDRDARRLFIISGGFIIVYYALQWLVDAGWFRPPDRALVTAVERLFSGAASVTDRYFLWGGAWTMWLENPAFGTGWGTFSARYFEYMSSAGGSGTYSLFHNPHNIVLHFMAETGLTGALILVVPPLLWLRQAGRGRRDAGWWWLLAVMAVLALHSLLEYPLWYAYFLGVAALLLGIAPAAVFVPRLARMGRLLAVALMAVGTLNLTTAWLDYREFERIFFTPTAALREQDHSESMSRLHRNPLLTPYIELASALPLEVAGTDLDQRIFLTDRALHFAPLPILVYRQVLLLALADRVPEAQALLRRARRVHPAAPPEFERDLARLVREHPARFRPLLESAVPVPGGP